MANLINEFGLTEEEQKIIEESVKLIFTGNLDDDTRLDVLHVALGYLVDCINKRECDCYECC